MAVRKMENAKITAFSRDVHAQDQIRRVSSIAGTEPDHIPSLPSVPTAEAKPGGWAPTLVHTSGELKFTVIRVLPGGEVPLHYHHEVWDYFVPLQGEGVIEVVTESGRVEKYPMDMHSFMAMPPKIVHRVRNNLSEVPFVFLIAQSPRTKYDFIAQ
jgi:mannose-6-phosphate isomerase-like protein (cupin superfamily)